MKKTVLYQLTKVADALDRKGEYKLANEVDAVLRKISGGNKGNKPYVKMDDDIETLDYSKDSILEKMKDTVDPKELNKLQRQLDLYKRRIEALHVRDFEQKTQYHASTDNEFDDPFFDPDGPSRKPKMKAKYEDIFYLDEDKY